jgi:hypothetical protein
VGTGEERAIGADDRASSDNDGAGVDEGGIPIYKDTFAKSMG